MATLYLYVQLFPGRKMITKPDMHIMKSTNKILSLTLILSITLLAHTGAMAQQNDGSDIFIGGGLTYGESIDELGLQLGGYYIFNEDFRFGGDFIYWFVDSPQDASNTFFELNGNAHYLFYREGDITLYGIGSLGIHYNSFEVTFNGGSISDSNTDLALGVGAGIEYNAGPVLLYGEPRFFLTGFDQLTLSFGVRFGI
ncbi:outer membrane beta-barrel protein [Balneolales bacterium ANBcel1]|nr:outer membrane beta-barrel protein [Balneolales bacterium ANBcel1]